MVLEVEERVDDSIDLPDASAHAVDTGALDRLPVQVMKRILFTVDADTFSSLTVLNQKWRKVSEDPEIYAHHLVKCHVFAAFNDISFESMKTRDLAELKRMFRREIRRNAFQIFLRPRRTLLNLISSSVGSSAALPTGEALKFEFSANGHILLSLSSSRIFVLDLTAAEIKVLYELKTSRMPLAATILDDGRVLAVSSSRHQVNIYRLSKDEAVHVQALTLNDVPRALALAPNGTVLGIGYDGSIEVHALGEDAVALQCRAVRCGRIDTLSFSHDGSMLLGSSLDSPDVGFVTVNAPFPTDSMVDLSNQEAHMWTTQILFPDQMQGFGHVTLLPGRMSGDDDWLVGFDNNLKIFRTVCPREHKLGSTYFAAPLSLPGCEDYMPCLSPAVDPECEILALGFRGDGLFIYGLPDDLNATPVNSTGSSVPQASEGHDRSVASRLEKGINQPSLIVEGRKIADIPGLTAARWVGRSRGEDQNISRRQRLVAVAPGGVTSSSLGHEAIPLDGGRICIFDFRIAASDGETVEKTIELGVEVPLLLREPDANLEQEVELERRRTQLRRNASTRPGLDRRALVDTAAVPPMPDVARQNSRSPDLPALEPAAGDVTLFLDGPYSNTAPRSRVTLQRAATAAASNRRAQHVAREQERSRLPTLQIPHESDADNWVPPPPPYTPDPDQPLPEHLRQLLLPTMTAPPGGVMDQRPQQPRRASTNEADGLENQGSRGSGLISRRWSTRRRTADATDSNTVGALLSFRPFSFHRLSSADAQQEASSLNNRLPPEHGRVSSEEIRISRQTNEDSQMTDSTRPVSIGIPKRQSRNSRILGTFRRSTSHGSVASQSNDGGQSHAFTDSRTRRKPVMRHGRFSRSSPNLVSGGNTTINRMSTIHSNASRSIEQNGGIQRSRSRSEAAQPPAPLTEEALEHAVAMQNSRLTSGQNEPALQTTISQQQQQPPPPPPLQGSTAAEDAHWQQPNMTESDEWRARIEAWNMETINERRKSRGKNARCVVM